MTQESKGDARHELLAVNGGLMRGLKATERMVEVGALFVREAKTEPRYRLWSIDDLYPAMLCVAPGEPGAAIAVEVWSVTPESLIEIYRGEPGWLSLGWIKLDDGETVLGVLGEPGGLEGQLEITKYGGWRAYAEAKGFSG